MMDKDPRIKTLEFLEEYAEHDTMELYQMLKESVALDKIIIDKQAEKITLLKELLNRAYGYVVGNPCGYAMGLPTEILEALKESEDK